MSGMSNPIIFYPIASMLILFAILSVNVKNIFHSLLSAIIVFFLTGVVFYLLGSEYNAVIQVAVYGVAVPIIIGLEIMFTSTKQSSQSQPKENNFKYCLYLVSGIFVLALIYLVLTSIMVVPNGFNLVEDLSFSSSLQVFTAISKSLYIKYVWAFELMSLILTIIVVGLTVLNKEEKCKK